MNEKKLITLALIVGLLVLAILIFSKKHNSSKTLSKTGIDAPTQNPDSSFLKTMTESSGMVERYRFQTILKKDRMEKEIGIKRMTLPTEGKNAILNVVLTIKPSCSPGDADAIIQDLSKVSSHRVLATLEDLAGKQKNLYWEIPQSFFKQGRAENTFKIPVDEAPTQYGFFLCTANSSDSSCSDKKIRDINEIFTEHLTKKPNAGQELRNIFFQYFLIDDRGIAALSKPYQGDKIYGKLKQYADEFKAPSKANHLEIDFAKKAIQTINSLPAVFTKNRLVLELPKFKESACR